MARSGSVDYSLTAEDVLLEAFRLTGVIRSGGEPGVWDKANGYQTLNLLLRRLANQGLYLHVLSEGHLFLVDGQESYDLGSGGDNATAENYVKTEIATAADTGDSSIEVDSITGISDTNIIGVELDDGTVQWTTANGAPSGSTVTLTDALTDDAALDNHVYAYAASGQIEKPQRILTETIRVENEGGTEAPVRLISRAEYLRLPTKDSTGSVNQVYYDQQYGATGKLYVWPTASDVKSVLHFTFERPLQDVDTSSDNVDFPLAAHSMLTYALALDLAPAYSHIVKPQQIMLLKALRDEHLEDYLCRDSEEGSIFFQPRIG